MRWGLCSLCLMVLAACGGSDEPGARPAAMTDLPDTPQTEELVLWQSALLRETSPSVSAAELRATAESVSRFGSMVFGAWASRPENAGLNLVFSPLSLYSPLLMAQAGAENETLRQMSAALQLPVPREQANVGFNALDLELESRGVLPNDGTLRNVNGLFLATSQIAQPAYLDVLAVNFGAGVVPIETSTADGAEASRVAVNAWFEAQTSGKFPEFLSPGALVDARLVIANAVTFKGAWKQAFDPSLTKTGDFVLLSGESIQTQFMEQSVTAAVTQDSIYDAVGLSFMGEDFVFQVVVPKAGQFQTVEAAIRADPGRDFLESASPAFVRVVMPKFNVDTALSTEDLLIQLGMVDAFDPTRADFSGIDGTRLLHISKVIHKAAINVDEKGAEASAGSAVVLTPPNVPGETVAIDRPFFFAIRDAKTGVVAFMGRVMNPTL